MPMIECCNFIAMGEGPNGLNCPACGKECTEPNHRVKVRCDFSVCKHNDKGICSAPEIEILIGGYLNKDVSGIEIVVPVCFE